MLLSSCIPYGYIAVRKNQSCNSNDASDCCTIGNKYPIYKCSPSSNQGILTLNGFGKGEDGGSEAECDGKYHSNNEHIVALSTGWYGNGKNCGKNITIFLGNAKTTAKIVDECDSTAGCDSEHDHQPPCKNNIIDASAAVWKSLGVSPNDDIYGYANVTWKF